MHRVRSCEVKKLHIVPGLFDEMSKAYASKKKPLQLLLCIYRVVAGLQITWDRTVYSLTCMYVDKSERLAFNEGILFIVFFSKIWTGDIWLMTDYIGAVQEFSSGLFTCLVSSGVPLWNVLIFTPFEFCFARAYI